MPSPFTCNPNSRLRRFHLIRILIPCVILVQSCGAGGTPDRPSGQPSHFQPSRAWAWRDDSTESFSMAEGPFAFGCGSVFGPASAVLNHASGGPLLPPTHTYPRLTPRPTARLLGVPPSAVSGVSGLCVLRSASALWPRSAALY